MKFMTPLIYTLIYFSIILVNYLANALPINGMNTGELSDKYNSLITPAGTAFSIWGLIYLLLLIYIIRVWIGFIKKEKEVIDESRMILPWFIWNGLFNIGWLFAWHYEYVNVSILIMVGLLISLIFIYRKRDIIHKLPMVPFSVYLGWISVASIVNASVVILYNGWDGTLGNAITWTVVLEVVAILLGIFITWSQKDGWYGLVIAWALLFIAIKNDLITQISYTAFAGMGLITALSIFCLFTKQKFQNQ